MLTDIKSHDSLYYLLTVSVTKCCGSFTTIDDPYARNINVKVFNLTPRENKTKFLVRHESCECKCRLNEDVYNSKQKWSRNKCRCRGKELVD